jgi:maleylacetoacetate isomerase/maleylpyruvate isomerase
MSLVLHSYWRATAPYRVRIGLNLKGLAYDYVPVNLIKAEQSGPDHLARNPQGLVPALETGEVTLTQSLAILEWLEETHPTPPLLPTHPNDRAVVRAMAGLIACDIHPLNNMRVQKKLAALGVDEAGRSSWSQGWITSGFVALEAMVVRHGAGFAFGDKPGLADCLLIPQAYSAERYGVDLTPFPAIRAVAERSATLPAFADAHPDRQTDAQIA